MGIVYFVVVYGYGTVRFISQKTTRRKIMSSTLPPTTWLEEDIVIWENMDATTKREFVLSSAFADVRKKPSEWLYEKLGETK